MILKSHVVRFRKGYVPCLIPDTGETPQVISALRFSAGKEN